MKLLIVFTLFLLFTGMLLCQNDPNNNNVKRNNKGKEYNSTTRKKPSTNFIDQISTNESNVYQSGSENQEVKNYTSVNQIGKNNKIDISQENSSGEFDPHGTSTSISQLGDFNEAKIKIIGWWNTFGSISQTGYSNYALQILGDNNFGVKNSSFTSVQSGSHNKSEQYMNGLESIIGLNNDNIGAIYQLGDFNYAIQSMQNGYKAALNNAFLFSKGFKNESYQYMKGSKNVSEVHQEGEGNVSKSIQN